MTNELIVHIIKYELKVRIIKERRSFRMINALKVQIVKREKEELNG